MTLRIAKNVLLLADLRVGMAFRPSAAATLSLFRRHQIWQRRAYSSAEVLMAPQADDDSKRYSPKIQNIVQEISKLTLIEVADLNELLKKTLKIADAPMATVAAVAAPKAAAKEDDTDAPAPVQQKVAFTVKLVKFDETKKVALIKEIKNLVTGMNLVQAKKFVESVPQNVRTDVPKEEAETLKKALEALGANVEIV